MLKQLTLENWKSFRHAELYIDPITVLIGTNASGKSNAIEALDFLSRVVQGMSVQSALVGDRLTLGIRGGAEWAVRKPEKQFTLKALVGSEGDETDYLYCITIEVSHPTNIKVLNESIFQVKQDEGLNTDALLGKRCVVDLNLTTNFEENFERYLEFHQYNAEIKKRLFPRQETKLSPYNIREIPFYNFQTSANIFKSAEIITNALKNIFILNINPVKMRDYSPISESLERDGANLAGVLAGLPKEKKVQVEATLSKYISQLPEGDMQKVWAEAVGRLESDAMLYCEEVWVRGELPRTIDARGMSDGS